MEDDEEDWEHVSNKLSGTSLSASRGTVRQSDSRASEEDIFLFVMHEHTSAYYFLEGEINFDQPNLI